ncbi:MAG TPA: carboxypeptidase-like regulatory domain-containing protein, partial [Vicinamibacterales bacterium]|nr:carboxypeptidase-like regulatory domain-containing protein [Vicinamibacterales bacterium]
MSVFLHHVRNAALILLALSATAALAQTPAGVVMGLVSLPAPDGQPAAVPGVTLTLICGDAQPRTDVSGPDGTFRFEGAQIGSCAIVASLDGFKPVSKTIVIKAGEPASVVLLLEIESLHQVVQVTASRDGISSDTIAAKVETVSQDTINRAPIASSRFQDALPLIPGVVRGPDGQISVSGSRSSQMAIMLSNTLSTDPITGEDAVQLPLDAVDEVQVHRAAFAPEFGLSNGAVTTVQMKEGGDAWSFSFNDLEPRARFRDGSSHGIESWTPRFSVGGPIVKGRLNLFEAVEYGYSQTPVFSLPPVAQDTKDESFESYTRIDWKPTVVDHISASLVVAPRKTTYAGLNTFNPQPVTSDIEKQDYFVTLTHQRVVGQSGVLDSWIGLKQFGRTVDPSQREGPMVLAPDVNSGSYFNSQDVTSRRAEFVSNYTFTPFGPAHVLKAGAGAGWEGMTGVMTSR